MLYSLPDGRTIAEMKLEAEPALRDITLFESGSKYFLVTSDSTPEDLSRQPGRGQRGFGGGVLQIMGRFQMIDQMRSICSSKPVQEGRLYAFDSRGKLLWPAPVKIENQRVALNQPTELPILTFACRVLDEDESSGQYNGYKTSLLCIDKRNGRTVYQAEGYERSGYGNMNFRTVGDAEKKTVNLMTWSNTVTLTFTDKPWPATSTTDAAVPKSP